MQDFLPDVPKKPSQPEEAQELAESSQPQGWLDKLRQRGKGKKQVIWLVLGLGGLVLLAIIVSIVEKVQQKRVVETEVSQGELVDWLSLVEKKPGQMAFGFYLDENSNGEFEHNEKPFSGVSVSVRRPGEAEAFRTVASDVNGRVIVDDLVAGEYEISLVNYELDEVRRYGDFELPNFFELVDETKQRFEFLPSSWQPVTLEEEGYRLIVGVREYQPERLLVLTDSEEVSFYDPERFKVYGESVIGDGVRRQFLVRDKEVMYLKDDQLKKFSFRDKVEAVMMDRLYGVDEESFGLSPEARTVIYTEDDELRYTTKDDHCGEGAIIYDGQRLNLKQTPKLMVDFWDEDRFVFVGTVEGGEWGVYKGFCGERDKFEAESLEIGEVRSLQILNDKTLFYVNNQGSYFYDLDKKEATRYIALGVAEAVVVSEDGKYIAGKVGGGYVIVDYPAVVMSGVEKHYVLAGVNRLVLSGDEVLINQAKACEQDGDCGQVARIKLKGNGVWEWAESVDLIDIVVRQVLGEVKL